MNEKEIRATAPEDKPVRLGHLPLVKENILENARQYDKGVVGGYSGTFPLTAASQGGIYLLPSTGKFYVCTENYNGTQISAPNDKFVELSVWKNHDRLNNLINKDNQYFIIDKFKICFGTVQINKINEFEEFFLPLSYEKAFIVLVTDTAAQSIVSAYRNSLNSFKVLATIKSSAISYITIGY